MIWLNNVVRISLGGGLPLVIFVLAILAGTIALLYTPREEEPQIVVPVVDVNVHAPGLSARQVERQVTTPLEKLLTQIPGVEHVYSSSSTGQSTVTLRFYVGENREDSLLNTYNKLYSNQHQIPPVVSEWFVHPAEVDDVPIVVLGLWSTAPARYGDYQVRRLAEEVATYLQTIERSSEVKVVGGRARKIQVRINPEALAAHQTSVLEITAALRASNLLRASGDWTFGNERVTLQTGDVVRSLTELGNLVVHVVDGNPIFLRDVAAITDGPAEPDYYTWLTLAGDPENRDQPMVAISLAKQRGSNAVQVARDTHALMAELKATVIPPEIEVAVLRDYGETANEKVNNLTQSLIFALFTVVVFLGVFLGWRQAMVVALALPICYGVTLALDLALGYTINRVTLFALILALGLLVDDPITGVDNVTRHYGGASNPGTDRDSRIINAIAEIRIPLVMSTITIVVAFLPLAFITGMMGPYMAPMAFNVPVSVITSTLVAFLVTPWLAKKFLGTGDAANEDTMALEAERQQLYGRLLGPFITDVSKARKGLVITGVVFVIVCSLPLFRLVPLKLLPYDNKNEVQILIDLPESASLEETAAVARSVVNDVSRLPEVKVIAAFVGIGSPIDFNGLVRRYYQREADNLADLRLVLADKSAREHQSHHIVLRLRELLAPINDTGVVVKVVEVPPGPPVMSTLVAEIYSTPGVEYDVQESAALGLAERLRQEAHVVEVDTSVPGPSRVKRFVVDKRKAALSGISTRDVADTISTLNRGSYPTYLQFEREAAPLPIELRLARQDRQQEQDFLGLTIKGTQQTSQSTQFGLEETPQPLVALGEIGHFETLAADHTIHRKDLKPVVYVTAEISGRTPAEVIADVHADLNTETESTTDWQDRNFFSSGAGITWSLPEGTDYSWRGEGEWQITLDVFRDMGIAFLFALVAIFVLLRVQTASVSLSLIIMSAIPLTMIGIMPGFWLLNQFGERMIAGAPEPVLFTATAMIGMIALAGIVVRNSLILVEFISQSRATGMPIQEALLKAGAVRMRPVLLTAGTTLLGNLVITLDPVFSGLALAIIFGIIASTLFTLFIVPVVYFLVFREHEPEIIQ